MSETENHNPTLDPPPIAAPTEAAEGTEALEASDTSSPENGAPQEDAPAPEDAESDEASLASSAPELPQDEMSFAEMFELAEKAAHNQQKTVKTKRSMRAGKTVEATIVGFSQDAVFLDMGGKAEGQMARADLLDDEGNLTLKEGDKVEARILTVEGGTVKLGKVLGHESARNRDTVRQAFEAELAIEGRVTGQNKGGLEVEVGGLRAFCPISQIDLAFCKDPSQFLGRKLLFKITEFKNNGRNVVVSRRHILEEEQRKAAEVLLEKIEVGQQVLGKVTSVRDYGAFVDIGGLEGLIHVSELSHGRVKNAGEVVKSGQEVTVEILKISDDKKGTGKKISLSLKSLMADPWATAQEHYREGMQVIGKVSRIQNFGAFIELLPGVDGLIHVSNMSHKRLSNPRDIMKEGDEVEATVVTTDWKNRRIGLSMVESPQELARKHKSGQIIEGKIDRIESYGLFVELPSGARGLVPAAESGTQRGADLKKEFKLGDMIKVSVLDADKKSGKIRLSIRAVAQAEERALYASYMGKSSQGKGLGTLGDLFKDRLAGKK